jgi:hypothetical protein
MVQREEHMTLKKPIQNQDKNSGSLEGSTDLASLKEEVEAIHDFQFEKEAYFEAVVDMEEWL